LNYARLAARSTSNDREAAIRYRSTAFTRNGRRERAEDAERASYGSRITEVIELSVTSSAGIDSCFGCFCCFPSVDFKNLLLEQYAVDLEKDSVAVHAADFLFSGNAGCASPFERHRRIEMHGLHHCSLGVS
jgi:hypothetical protein